MSQYQQSTHSVWQKTVSLTDLPKLQASLETDVCIVGAGIAGLTSAYLLLKRGIPVVVIDKECFGENESGLTTAHLSNALDDRYTELRKWHGDHNTRLAYESHTEAIRLIEKIVQDENIECDFKRVDGYLFLDPDHSKKDLQEELKAAHAIGFTDVEYLQRAPTLLFESGPCLRFPQQAQFHPLKYLRALAQRILALGGHIYEQTKAVEIKGGAQAFVKTEDGPEISCKHIIVATNVPVNDLVTMHTKEYAYRSYVIGVRIPRSEDAPALFWDMLDPYHYIRTQPLEGENADVLIVGGEDHRTGQCDHPEKRYAELEKWTQQRLGITPEVLFRWSGQIIEPVDGLAYIGLNPGDEDNVYIASADSGHGMTHGTIAGMIFSDLIYGIENKFAALYSPRRFNWKRLGEYARENIQGASSYADWLALDDKKTPEDLALGEGAIFFDGLAKVAIYRDEEGLLHEFSAACPHLKGVVRWNSAEKTWDCPFHGSRFSKMGEVLNGPAMKDLASKGLRAKEREPYTALPLEQGPEAPLS